MLPLAVGLGVYLARSVSHALFVLLMATLVALLLNPVAEILRRRIRLPRGVSVPVVYLALLSILGLFLFVAVPPLARQARALVERAPEWGAMFNQQLPTYEAYLARYDIVVDLSGVAALSTEWLGSKGLQSLGTIFNLGVGVAGGAATVLLVLIASFYMLIDGRRIFGSLVRAFPTDDVVAEAYLRGMQVSFTRYVKGQAVLASSVGLAAGLGVWVLGWDVVGVWPEGSQYALLFGVWAGVTEVIPYVGPWLGAIPPVLLALFHSPMTAVWVAVLFWLVQLLENHILVPNIMGTSVGVHPLVVIFSLLAGVEVGGIVGMLAVLPILAMARHTFDFFEFRLSRAAWVGDDDVVPVEVPNIGGAGPGFSDTPQPTPEHTVETTSDTTPAPSAHEDTVGVRE